MERRSIANVYDCDCCGLGLLQQLVALHMAILHVWLLFPCVPLPHVTTVGDQTLLPLYSLSLDG